MYLFILAALGLAVTSWRWRELLFIYVVSILIVAQNIIYYGSARLRAPIDPMLILLAAGCIWWVTHKEIRQGYFIRTWGCSFRSVRTVSIVPRKARTKARIDWRCKANCL